MFFGPSLPWLPNTRGSWENMIPIILIPVQILLSSSNGDFAVLTLWGDNFRMLSKPYLAKEPTQWVSSSTSKLTGLTGSPRAITTCAFLTPSDSDEKCSIQMRIWGVLNTADKLSTVVWSSLLLSPVTHTVTQNLRDCFANIFFFFPQKYQDSRELIWTPSFKQQSKSKKRLLCSAYICVMSILSVICQAAENTILLLDYLYLLGKGCTHTTSVSFLFCQTSSAPYCRKEEVKWAQTSQKRRKYSGTVNPIFQTPMYILCCTDQFISAAPEIKQSR